jgi:hypothetical protein
MRIGGVYNEIVWARVTFFVLCHDLMLKRK